MLRNFSTLATKSKNRLKFKNLNLNPLLCKSLKDNDYNTPTPVQAALAPAYLEGKKDHFIISSATGSGKTLAYMLPIVHELKRTEAPFDKDAPAANARPRAVIIAPTRELVLQILSVAKTLCHETKFSSVPLVGGKSSKGKKHIATKALKKPFDMLITTPDALLRNFTENKVFLSKMEHLVLDEADVLLGGTSGFKETLNNFLPKYIGKKEGLRTIFVGATVAKKVEEKGRDQTKSSLHYIQSLLGKPKSVLNFIDINSEKETATIARQARVRFIRCENKDKHPELAGIVRASVAARILVFCNSVASCRSTDYVLNTVFAHEEAKTGIYCLHGAMPPKMREDNYQAFLKEEKEKKVLICTDLAGRGLDLDVRDVVMFDLPKSTTDFVHRAGRTGRSSVETNGEAVTGRVYCLVAKAKYDYELQARLQRNLSLPLNPHNEQVAPRMNPRKISFRIKTHETTSAVTG